MIAIITPWSGNIHLLPAYARAIQGATPIIVDTSDNGNPPLEAFCEAAQGVYLRDTRRPFSYAAACNFGLKEAASLGATHAVCLNNDIEGDPAWLADVARLPDGVLAGQELLPLRTAGQPHVYAAGWGVAATMATWERVAMATLHDSGDPAGPWDSAAYVGCYHEDVDLSWRAARMGIYLQARPWGLRHLGEQTTRVTPGATDNHAYNRSVFERRVRAWQEGAHCV